MIPERVGVAHIAAERVDRLVATDVHHLEQRSPTGGRGREEARSQAVSRKRAGIEPQASAVAGWSSATAAASAATLN
jgi:hypothetical protein